jgi:PAS domain S-box-containing protein
VPAAGSLPLVDLATLDLLPDPAWVATLETGLAHFNTAWLAMTGTSARVLSAEEFLALVHPDDREVPRTDWRAARDAPGSSLTSQFRIRSADGAYRWFLMRAVPVHRDAAVAGWLATITDIDAERRIREELVASEARARSIADAIPQLIGITSADGKLLSVNERYTAYTGKTIAEIRETAWTSTIHPDDVEQMVASWERAVQVGEPHDAQYRLRGRDGVYRWFLNKAIPVRDAGGVVTAWIATATDIDERKRAEDALQVVVEASTAFAGTLDASVVLQHLADVSAANVADWCGVYLYDAADHLRAVAIAHRDPNKVRFVREYLRRFPIRDQDAAALVASAGIPLRIDEITDDMYDAIEDEEQRELARSLGLRSVLYIPLGDDHQRYGVFSLAIAESNRRFTDEDQQLATLIAQRASIAVANARLYERQREVAGTLQAAFLPPALPHTPAVTFDATYAAGTRDLTIGGDWYDAFACDDGTIAISIGDVAGRGLEAAVPMGKMRQTFRALGVLENDPARWLVVADSVLRHEHPDIFVTAFIAAYEPDSRRLRYANAGHPPPFIRSFDGTLARLDAAGVPLGLGDFDPPRTREDGLAFGDLLVAFTDGLIETTRDLEAGEHRVAEVLVHPAFGLCSKPAALLRALVVPDVPGDDVAILTVRAGGGANWSFDANDGTAAQAAREAFVARLAAEGVSHDDRLAYEIVFGEIVGNAARYTPGPLDLVLERSGTRFVLAALDRGPGFDWDGRPPRDAFAENGRGLFLIETLASDVHVERMGGYGTYLQVTLAR